MPWIFKNGSAAHPDSADFERDLALTYGNVGLLARSIDQPARAESNYREAIRIQEQLAAKHADQPEYLHHLAVSFNNLSFLQAKSEPVKAEESSRKARAIQEQLAAAHPANTEYQSDLALSFNNLGAWSHITAGPSRPRFRTAGRLPSNSSLFASRRLSLVSAAIWPSATTISAEFSASRIRMTSPGSRSNRRARS